MDMGGHQDNLEYLRQRFTHAKILRWTNHLHTIRRCVVHSRTRYCWVLSSCIDYSKFDFLWEPTPWQAHQIHCWPSGNQRFGDTFLIPVDCWREQESKLSRLEDFKDVNFEHDSLIRLPWHRVVYNNSTIPEVLKTVQCPTPYVFLTNQDRHPQTDPWLWREQPVVAESTDNGCTLIPRSALGLIQQQVYDYAWLEKSHLWSADPLDIVFISNGEHGADHHYQILQENLQKNGCQNRLFRVDKINGRVACYQAAAKTSRTDWFFAVFAKLQINEDFDWTWQPDRWQQPKHYIFHAYNPVNHLIYGHQAMIAYNRRLVLENMGLGLDFTLDQPHEVVPICAGTAYYDNDPWMAWRTAFREALKLRHSLPDVENEYRLDVWLHNGEGINGRWSTTGARDAVNYYESVKGDFDQLKKSYEWDWLASYAVMLHPQLFTQSKT